MKATRESWYLERQGDLLFFGNKRPPYADTTKTLNPEATALSYRPPGHVYNAKGKMVVAGIVAAIGLIDLLNHPQKWVDWLVFSALILLALWLCQRAVVLIGEFNQAQSLIGRGCEDLRDSLIYAQLRRAIENELIAEGAPSSAGTENIFRAYVVLGLDQKHENRIAQYFKAAQDNGRSIEELRSESLTPARIIVRAILRDA